MKWLCGFFLMLFALMAWQPTNVAADTAAPAVAPTQEKVVLPPGGFYVALVPYFPKVPDLAKMTVPSDQQGQPPREMKPSEWLAQQTPKTVEFAPAERPMFFYFSSEWKNPLNDRTKLVKDLQLAAPISMTIKGKDGKEIKVDGAVLYKVAGTFGTKEEFLKAYPPVAQGTNESSNPAAEPEVALVDAKGTFKTSATTEMGAFDQSGGPFEEGWSDARQQQDLAFMHDLMKDLGCFIATAVFQSWDAPQLTVLRAFRDRIMLTSPEGVKLVSYYYQHGPYWAQDLQSHPVLKAILRPLLSGVAATLNLMNLDSPATQKILQTSVGWVEWMVSPFMSSEPQTHTTIYPVPQ